MVCKSFYVVNDIGFCWIWERFDIFIFIGNSDVIFDDMFNGIFGEDYFFVSVDVLGENWYFFDVWVEWEFS